MCRHQCSGGICFQSVFLRPLAVLVMLTPAACGREQDEKPSAQISPGIQNPNQQWSQRTLTLDVLRKLPLQSATNLDNARFHDASPLNSETTVVYDAISGTLLDLGTNPPRATDMSLVMLNGYMRRVRDVSMLDDGRAVVVTQQGGYVCIVDLASGSCSELWRLSLSSTSSLVIIDDSPLTVAVVGTFRDRRVHIVNEHGEIIKSMIDDVNYSESPPPFSVGGDVIDVYGDFLLYYHPVARGFWTIMKAGWSVEFTEIPLFPEFESAWSFDKKAFGSRDEAKKAFPFSYTPLKWVGLYRESQQVITGFFVGRDHDVYDVWNRTSNGNLIHIGRISSDASLRICTTAGNQLVVMDRAESGPFIGYATLSEMK